MAHRWRGTARAKEARRTRPKGRLSRRRLDDPLALTRFQPERLPPHTMNLGRSNVRDKSIEFNTKIVGLPRQLARRIKNLIGFHLRRHRCAFDAGGSVHDFYRDRRRLLGILRNGARRASLLVHRRRYRSRDYVHFPIFATISWIAVTTVAVTD